MSLQLPCPVRTCPDVEDKHLIGAPPQGLVDKSSLARVGSMSRKNQPKAFFSLNPPRVEGLSPAFIPSSSRQLPIAHRPLSSRGRLERASLCSSWLTNLSFACVGSMSQKPAQGIPCQRSAPSVKNCEG